jgi:hypothetical protein
MKIDGLGISGKVMGCRERIAGVRFEDGFALGRLRGFDAALSCVEANAM